MQELSGVCHTSPQYDLETAPFKRGCVAQSKDRILRKQLVFNDLLGGAEGDGLGERCNRTAEVRGSTPLGDLAPVSPDTQAVVV